MNPEEDGEDAARNAQDGRERRRVKLAISAISTTKVMRGLLEPHEEKDAPSCRFSEKSKIRLILCCKYQLDPTK